MNYVKPKKHLGQHFLKDEGIAERIVESLLEKNNCDTIFEVGPGTGVLTKYLLQHENIKLFAVEVDADSVTYLEQHYPTLAPNIIKEDFLKLDFSKYTSNNFSVIGNFPYNISSQILFKILDHKEQIPLAAGMFQKEVAERIAAPPGSRTYGIISVLMQAYYNIEYLFTVNEDVFNPPPKVKSAVIRLTRNQNNELNCNEILFKKIVKQAFNQRRKMLRNALSPYKVKHEFQSHHFMQLRAERLSVKDFVDLTNMVEV